MAKHKLFFVTALLVALLATLTACGGAAPASEAEANTTTATVTEPQLISPQDYQSQFAESDQDYVLLDVRTPEEFQAGHISGAVNISVQTLAQRLNEVPTDKPVVVYCRSGNRSNTATSILDNAGYTNVYDIDGGTIAWTASGLPLE